MNEPTILVEVVAGVEGDCLVINNRRVAGPKPWGPSGRVVQSWRVSHYELIRAIPGLLAGLRVHP